MRRVTSILLIIILLFNWFGYRLLLTFMEGQANIELEAQLNENKYDESQLISIKVPVRYLPYYNNSSTFERVDGQIEVKGILYKYVKRRIFADSLEMMCIPNHQVMKLQTARNEFFKFTNDLQTEKKSGQHSSVAKSFSSDYYTTTRLFCLTRPYLTLIRYLFCPSVSLTSLYSPTAERPPAPSGC